MWGWGSPQRHVAPRGVSSRLAKQDLFEVSSSCCNSSALQSWCTIVNGPHLLFLAVQLKLHNDKGPHPEAAAHLQKQQGRGRRLANACQHAPTRALIDIDFCLTVCLKEEQSKNFHVHIYKRVWSVIRSIPPRTQISRRRRKLSKPMKVI